jgi:hypothetical protein
METSGEFITRVFLTFRRENQNPHPLSPKNAKEGWGNLNGIYTAETSGEFIDGAPPARSFVQGLKPFEIRVRTRLMCAAYLVLGKVKIPSLFRKKTRKKGGATSMGFIRRRQVIREFIPPVFLTFRRENQNPHPLSQKARKKGGAPSI